MVILFNFQNNFLMMNYMG